jgi:trimethylamine--corrinoid protein Co-methyltransferase
MNVKGNFFSQEEIENMHEMTLRVLEKDGVVLESDYACEVFKKHGAKVDGHVVHMGRSLVEEAISTAPSEFTIRGRKDKAVTLGEGHKVLAPASGPLFVLRGDDHHSNTAEDFKNFQKMDHTSKVINMLNPNLIEPADIDRSIVRDYQMAVCLKYTDKPLMGLTTSMQDCIHSVDMIQRFYGADKDETVTFGLINPMSPLKYNETMLDACRYFAERNQATMFPCCSMPGVTSPVTLSGTVVVNNAENLAGIIYTQLIRPGAPVVYSNTSAGCDLRYITPAIGAPETALISFAAASLAKYYNIPCRTGGSLADAKCVDWQAGVESTFTMMAALMSSASFVLHSCGVMNSFNTLSYEKYLLDEQNIEMMMKLVNGMTVYSGEEELENIHAVGPGGQYIEEEHTMDYMKEELYVPKLFNKMNYSSWEENGKKTAPQLASEQIEARIASWEPLDITKEQESVLREYIGDLYDGI